MDKKLIELYKCGNMTIPLYILKNRSNLNLGLDEFIFLMYLYNKGNDIIFNPGEISEELGISAGDSGLKSVVSEESRQVLSISHAGDIVFKCLLASDSYPAFIEGRWAFFRNAEELAEDEVGKAGIRIRAYFLLILAEGVRAGPFQY